MYQDTDRRRQRSTTAKAEQLASRACGAHALPDCQRIPEEPAWQSESLSTEAVTVHLGFTTEFNEAECTHPALEVPLPGAG